MADSENPVVQIYTYIEDGDALVNKSADTIAIAKAAVEQAFNDLNPIDPLLNPKITLMQKESLLAGLTGLTNKLDSFLAHTNRVSGVSFLTDGLGTKPDFMALLSVSSNLAYIQEQLDPANVTDVMGDFFGSLTGELSTLGNIPDIVNRIVPDILDPLASFDADQYLGLVTDFGSTLQNRITSEIDKFTSAIGTIRKWGLASTLNSPQQIWRDYLGDNVFTDTFQELVPAVQDRANRVQKAFDEIFNGQTGYN